MIRGGVKMKNLITNKTFTSKAINGIDATIKFNKELILKLSILIKKDGT